MDDADARDFDALSARLIAAEALLLDAVVCLDERAGALRARIDAHLERAEREDREAEAQTRCSAGVGAESNGAWPTRRRRILDAG